MQAVDQGVFGAALCFGVLEGSRQQFVFLVKLVQHLVFEVHLLLESGVLEGLVQPMDHRAVSLGLVVLRQGQDVPLGVALRRLVEDAQELLQHCTAAAWKVLGLDHRRVVAQGLEKGCFSVRGASVAASI